MEVIEDVLWFSCGATSAVMCKIMLKQKPHADIVYTYCGGEHPDNMRFLKDCEQWFGKEIKILKSPYKDHFEAIRAAKRLQNCTIYLKRRPSAQYEYENNIKNMYWGFEPGEEERLEKRETHKDLLKYNHFAPLIDKHITKENCLCVLNKAGIELPQMYSLGFGHNNCIGCPQGGMWYWNKIRDLYPDQFKEMSKIERELGYSCIKKEIGPKKYQKIFLDELLPNTGRPEDELTIQCGLFCEALNI